MIRIAFRYAPLLLLGLVWEGLARSGIVSEQMLPRLTSVLSALNELRLSGDLLSNATASLSRAAIGLGLALMVGVVVGAGMALVPWVHRGIDPIVQIFYPLPKSALIPLVLVWFGLGDKSKTFLVFLGCLQPVILASYNGLRGVDKLLGWSARSLGASPLQVVAEVMFPAALPQLLTGLRTALAFMFLLMVSSELVIATNGLGYLIGNFGDQGSYPEMFATILVVTAMGFFADRAFLMLSDRLLKWRP